MSWQRRLDDIEAYLEPFEQLGPEKLRAEFMIGLGLGSLDDWELVAHEDLEDARTRRLYKALYLRKERLLGNVQTTIRDYFDSAAEITSYLPHESVPQRYFDVIQKGLDDPRKSIQLGATRVLAEQGGLDGLPMRRRFAGVFREWLGATSTGEPRHHCALRDQLLTSGYAVPDYD